jgi:hypothetical protein
MRNSFFFCTLCLLLVNKPVIAQNSDEQAIRKILKAQETAWNQGNLHQFMKGYWESDSLLFIGKRTTYGYKTTLDNYLSSYPDTAHMGVFTSTIERITLLDKTHCFVVGKWALKRSVGDVGGYYSLLFRKIKGIWVIVVDHTS